MFAHSSLLFLPRASTLIPNLTDVQVGGKDPGFRITNKQSVSQ